MELGMVLSKEGIAELKNAENEELINAINKAPDWCACRYECYELVERARDAGAELPDADFETILYAAGRFFGFELD